MRNSSSTLLNAPRQPSGQQAPSLSEFHPFAMRLLSRSDLSALIRLRDEVLQSLPVEDMYVREADEMHFLLSHLGVSAIGQSGKQCQGGGGVTLGIFDREHLVAYGMLGLPGGNDPDHLGCFLDLSPEVRARTAYLTSCMVDPAYRGRSLQRRLLAARMSLAQTMGKTFCVAMVSLHNEVSRRNMMQQGLRVSWVGQIEGRQRQLMTIQLAPDPR